MAVKQTVVVTEISSRPVNTKRGPSATYSFKGNDGQWYQCGFTKPVMSTGDKVEFLYTDNSFGHQVDAKSIMVLATGSTTTTDVSAGAASAVPKNFSSNRGPSVFPIPALDGQRAIVRQNALTNARELVACYGNSPTFGVVPTPNGEIIWDFDKIVEITIRIARKFEAYSCGDLDLEEVMAEAKVKATE